jgi:hypothetical protein
VLSHGTAHLVDPRRPWNGFPLSSDRLHAMAGGRDAKCVVLYDDRTLFSAWSLRCIGRYGRLEPTVTRHEGSRRDVEGTYDRIGRGGRMAAFAGQFCSSATKSSSR